MVEHLPRPRNIQLKAALKALADPARDALRARDKVRGDANRDAPGVRHDPDADRPRARLGRDGRPLCDLDAAHRDRLL